jgi:nitrite reductase (NADH) small subunit
MSKLTKRWVVCKADLAPGERRIVQIDGKSVGIFNVNGTYYALHNRCPHMAGPLCAGPVTGTTRPTDSMEFVYERAGEIVRCGWHGWEFDIQTGRCLVVDKIRARTYPTWVENGEVIVQIG